MSDDQPFYSPTLKPPPPRQPKPGEPLWTLVKGVKRVDCELRTHGDPAGWECQCLYQGELAYGRRFDRKDAALEDAAGQRQRLLNKGWQDSAP